MDKVTQGPELKARVTKQTTEPFNWWRPKLRAVMAHCPLVTVFP